MFHITIFLFYFGFNYWKPFGLMPMLGWLITLHDLYNEWTRILWVSSSLYFLPYLLCLLCPTGICVSVPMSVPNQTQESKNYIYNNPCEYGKRYIGETCRPLQPRVNEQKRNTTNGERDNSKIVEHSWEQKHRFQWDKASIITKIENSRIRKLKESAFIHCTDHVISQPSIDRSPIWLPIIRPEIKRKNYMMVCSFNCFIYI